MADPGDRLLYALSAWGTSKWPRFDRAFRALASEISSENEEPLPIVRWRALLALSDLAHLDVRGTESERTFEVAPAVIARLPSAGLPRAVLCGARSPHTERELRPAAAAAGVKITATHQRSRTPYAPTAIHLQAETWSALEELASALNIDAAAVPPSWALMEISPTVTEWTAALDWQDESDVDWDRQVFDPEWFRFRAAQAAGEDPETTRLVRYVDRARGQTLTRLEAGRRAAYADANWARYLILGSEDDSPVRYDAETYRLAVPRGAPLPGLLSRALSLCSGKSSFMLAPGHGDRFFPGCHGYLVYEEIAPDLAGCLLRKLELTG